MVFLGGIWNENSQPHSDIGLLFWLKNKEEVDKYIRSLPLQLFYETISMCYQLEKQLCAQNIVAQSLDHPALVYRHINKV